jgi:hypothetical protein
MQEIPMTRPFVTLLSLLVGTAFSTQAFAAGQCTGTVTQLWTNPTDGIYFALSGSTFDSPAGCAQTFFNGVRHYVIKDETSEMGRDQVALLYSAAANGTHVELIGTGDCTRNSKNEDVLTLYIQP